MLVLVCVMLNVPVVELVVDIECFDVPVIQLAVDVLVAIEDDDSERVDRPVELIEALDVPERVPVLLPETDILDVDVLEEDLLCVMFPERVELLDTTDVLVGVFVRNDVNVQRVVEVCVCVSRGVTENLEEDVVVCVGRTERDGIPEADNVCDNLPLLLDVELPVDD